jgi:hypothetical protein
MCIIDSDKYENSALYNLPLPFSLNFILTLHCGIIEAVIVSNIRESV